MNKIIAQNQSSKVKYKTLTQKRLKELLTYNPKTGLFTRKMTCNNGIKIGAVAGHKKSDGYIVIRVDRKLYHASILAFLWMKGFIPEYEVDHKNRVTSDNRWENLRHVTHQCNGRNRSVGKNNTSGIIGVHWDKQSKGWRARISTDGNSNQENLGCFPNLKDAARARWYAEIKYNFPDCNSTSSAFLFLQENKK